MVKWNPYVFEGVTDMLAMPKFYDLHQLTRCHTDSDIETALDELEVGTDPGSDAEARMKTRTKFLHHFMGTTQQYCVGEPPDGFTSEQEYCFAKGQLLAINED